MQRASTRADALAHRVAELEQSLLTERAFAARAAANVVRLESDLTSALASAPNSMALELLTAKLASSESRAAEERLRVVEVKRLWKGVVDTMREEADAFAVALEDAQVCWSVVGAFQ